MFDTIELRVHDLLKHDSLCQYIRSIQNGYQKKRREIPVPKELYYGEYTESLEILKKEFIQYFDTGRELELCYKAFINVASSHYELLCFIDDVRNFVKFNFSIPKYLYGHNVMQFTKHPSIGFDLFQLNLWQTQSDMCFDRLLKFIKYFFKREFPTVDIDFKCVEIARVDLCYNQVFLTKEKALTYLNYQKGIKKKFSRENSDFSRDWRTTIFYRTADYSCKIYHKGTEFSKKDSKQLLKKNRNGGSFDVALLQCFADRILRYEMTFRPGKMGQIYKYGYGNEAGSFRRNCPAHRLFYSYYKDFRRIQRKVVKCEEDTIKKQRLLMEHPFKKGFHDFELMMGWTPRFMLDLHDDEIEFHSKTVDSTFKYCVDVAPFTRIMLNQMILTFKGFVEQFTVKSMPDIEDMIKSVMEYNQRLDEVMRLTGERKISISRIRTFCALVEKFGVDGVLSTGMIPKSTYYDMMKVFKKFGYTFNSVNAKEQIITTNDFEHYNFWYLTNYDRLSNKVYVA